MTTVPPGKNVATKKKQVLLEMGGVHVEDVPTIISTVLGSCVATCLFDPVRLIGGMNHILLPGDPTLKCPSNTTRYGVHAMELLINGLMHLGGNRNRMVAKVFGGANILTAFTGDKRVGERNARFVLDFLENEKIRLVGQDLGGKDSRKILFHTDTGVVWLRRTPSIYDNRISTDERQHLNRVRRKVKRPGAITIFS